MTTPTPPTLEQRMAACMRPPGAPVMRQRWQDLLFLHWTCPAAAVQATLPPGLFVDTFAGQAYLGVVPFFMAGVRPRFLPAVPGISAFPELNLRTYVHDAAGIPGVWFYSLDAGRQLAVMLARRFFHLPYFKAAMSAVRGSDGTIRYCSVRSGLPEAVGGSAYEYAPGAVQPAAAPGSLEHFLVERYRLYAAGQGKLWRGAVSHPPYPLREAVVSRWDDRLLPLAGFPAPGRPPDHALFSPGVAVEVFGLRPVRG
jgi:uncharacterized protein YqjF (DUF2071 family)